MDIINQNDPLEVMRTIDGLFEIFSHNILLQNRQVIVQIEICINFLEEIFEEKKDSFPPVARRKFYMQKAFAEVLKKSLGFPSMDVLSICENISNGIHCFNGNDLEYLNILFSSCCQCDDELQNNRYKIIDDFLNYIFEDFEWLINKFNFSLMKNFCTVFKNKDLSALYMAPLYLKLAQLYYLDLQKPELSNNNKKILEIFYKDGFHFVEGFEATNDPYKQWRYIWDLGYATFLCHINQHESARKYIPLLEENNDLVEWSSRIKRLIDEKIRRNSNEIDLDYLPEHLKNRQPVKEKLLPQIASSSRKRRSSKTKAIPKETVDQPAQTKSNFKNMKKHLKRKAMASESSIDDLSCSSSFDAQSTVSSSSFSTQSPPSASASPDVLSCSSKIETRSVNNSVSCATQNRANSQTRAHSIENDAKKNAFDLFADTNSNVKNYKAIKKYYEILEDKQEVDDPLDEENRCDPKDAIYIIKPLSELERLAKESPTKYLRCTLELDGAHSGYAIPLDDCANRKISRISLVGRRNCGRAMQGDKVLVELKNPKSDEHHGCVVGVLLPAIKAKYHLFICEVSSDKATLMRPLCGTVPKISVRNKEARERQQKMLNMELPKDEKFQYRQKNGMLSNRDKVRKTMNFCDLNEVCMYDVEPSSAKFASKSKYFFKFRSIMKVNRLLPENLFLVCYLHWRQNFHYPNGFVLAPVRHSDDMRQMTHIFARQYLLPLEYPPNCFFVKEAKEIAQSIKRDNPWTGRVDMRNVLTVTIDNPTTKDMDDALSCKELKDGTFEVGVHITDVTHFVKKDGSLDKEARRRCLTIYPPTSMKSDMAPNHMLPTQLSEDGLSLVESLPRLCLSVLFVMDAEGVLKKEPEIQETVICSNRRLNKEDVQSVIECREPNNSVDEKVKKMLIDLYKLAFRMRRRRLGPAAMVIQTDWCYSDEEFGIHFEAECLVEEFMVAANFHVAKYVCQKYPNEVVLRMQSPPRQSEVDVWKSKFSSLIPLSGKLSRCIIQLRQCIPSVIPWALALNEKIAKIITASVNESDYRRARKALLSEDRHPQLMLAIFEWYKIMNKAKYVVGCNSNTSHFDLQMKQYTHFTSPLRRYVDVIIHHFVKAGLRQEKAPFSKIDLELIVNAINARCTQNHHYDLECRRAEFSINMRAKPRLSHVVITEVNSEDLHMTDACIRGLGGKLQRVKHSKLSLQNKPQILASQSSKVKLQWSKQLFILPQGFSDPNLLRALCNRSTTSKTVLRLNPNRFFQFLQTDDNRDVSKLLGNLRESVALFNERSTRDLLNKIASNIKNKNNDFVSSVSSERKGVDQTNASEDMFHDTYVSFELDISLGSLLPVQFSRRLKSGREEPFIQLVHFCPTFKVCVEHRDDSIGCFASTTSQHVPKKFKSIEHYRNSWLPIVQMESAAVAVVADDTFSLESVRIDWSHDKKKKTWCGIFSLPESWCETRQIRFSDEERLDEDYNTKECVEEYVKERYSLDHFQDYLCIRYNLGDYTWLGHAGVTVVVQTIAHDLSDRIVGFRLHQTSMFDVNPPNAAISPISQKICATIEVTRKFLPNKRQEETLSRIVYLRDALASKIALFEENDMESLDCPELKDIERFDIVTGKKEIFIVNKNGRREKKWRETKLTCNRTQSDAISSAVTRPLTLIWGPPGTGKTTTGVMLSYWFAWINCKRDDRELFVFSDKNVETTVETESEIKDEALMQDFIAQSEEIKESALLDEEVGVPVDKWIFVKSREQERDEREQRDCQKKIAEEEREKNEKMNEKAFIDSKLQSRRQILYCGPSNSCINLVAGYMQSKLDQTCPKIVRVFSEQVELSHYPVPGSQICNSKLSQDLQVPEQMKDISLHELIRRREDKYGKNIRAFDALFAGLSTAHKFDSHAIIEQCTKLLSEYPMLRHLVLQKNPKNRAEISLKRVVDDYRKVVLYAKSLELQNYDIVLCTTSVSSSRILQLACRFEQIIVDEAGMCTEPETLIPLVYVPPSPKDKGKSASSYCKNFVLIGDHKQLRPIIQCPAAAELGLETSLFERFCNKAIMLNEQYRMHPSICEFPSINFYERQLITRPSPGWTGLSREDIRRNCMSMWNGINARDLIPTGEFEGQTIAMNHVFGIHGKLREDNVNILTGYWPGVRHEIPYSCLPNAMPRNEEERVVFVHVEGVEEMLYVSSQEGHEQSRGNADEADEVARIYSELRAHYNPPRLAYKGLAVLSQYRLQVNRIRERLKKEAFDAHVSTVISAQGSEFDYVILSLVRSMPKYNIDPRPTPGWERKYLGFITDENQINVALTRARRGLVIVGNKNLLRVYPMWEKLISDLEKRGCVVDKGTFPSKKPLRIDLEKRNLNPKKPQGNAWNTRANRGHYENGFQKQREQPQNRSQQRTQDFNRSSEQQDSIDQKHRTSREAEKAFDIDFPRL